MFTMWRNSWLQLSIASVVLAAFSGCAAPLENDAVDGEGAPIAEPAEFRAGSDNEPSSDSEAVPFDTEGLVLGEYGHWLVWISASPGSWSDEVVGKHAVIDGVQVQSDGNYINAIRFHYYYTGRADNQYDGGRYTWTGWYGANQGTIQEKYWCAGGTGMVGFSAFMNSGRISAASFACNLVDGDHSSDHWNWSPLFGRTGSGGGNSTTIYSRICEPHELLTSWHVAYDSTAITAMRPYCQDKW